MADFANVAAAIAGGWQEITLDRGSGWTPATRWEARLEKQLVGEPGCSGHTLRAYGQGSSQANAETQALAALNAQRTHRYGQGNVGSHGGTLTLDQN
jgi:hypothetical protein